MHRTDLERAAQKLLDANFVTRTPIPVEDQTPVAPNIKVLRSGPSPNELATGLYL